VKFSRKTTKGVRHDVQAIAAAFLGSLKVIMLGPWCAHTQSEIDPDQFDSPNTEPTPQPRPRITDGASGGLLHGLPEVAIHHSPLRPLPIFLRLRSVKLAKLFFLSRDRNEFRAWE
jgi:hypothetical protein